MKLNDSELCDRKFGRHSFRHQSHVGSAARDLTSSCGYPESSKETGSKQNICSTTRESKAHVFYFRKNSWSLSSKTFNLMHNFNKHRTCILTPSVLAVKNGGGWWRWKWDVKVMVHWQHKKLSDSLNIKRIEKNCIKQNRNTKSNSSPRHLAGE